MRLHATGGGTLPAGDGHAFVRADSASTHVEGEIRVSVHFGADSAEDFTAF